MSAENPRRRIEEWSLDREQEAARRWYGPASPIVAMLPAFDVPAGLETARELHRLLWARLIARDERGADAGVLQMQSELSGGALSWVRYAYVWDFWRLVFMLDHLGDLQIPDERLSSLWPGLAVSDTSIIRLVEGQVREWLAKGPRHVIESRFRRACRLRSVGLRLPPAELARFRAAALRLALELRDEVGASGTCEPGRDVIAQFHFEPPDRRGEDTGTRLEPDQRSHLRTGILRCVDDAFVWAMQPRDEILADAGRMLHLREAPPPTRGIQSARYNTSVATRVRQERKRRFPQGRVVPVKPAAEGAYSLNAFRRTTLFERLSLHFPSLFLGTQDALRRRVARWIKPRRSPRRNRPVPQSQEEARHLLSDRVWRQLQSILVRPPAGMRGPRGMAARDVTAAIIIVLQSGIPWTKLPARLGLGSGNTARRYLRFWQGTGRWEQAVAVLNRELPDLGIDVERSSRRYGQAGKSRLRRHR